MSQHTTTTKKHPSGLPYLFFTEMWERFGYYLMIGIFFLYMTDTEKGGLAMTNKDASDYFGTFIALVFLTPFVGGLLADRVMGYRLSITIGGIMMGIGYMGLALPGMTAFYLSSFLIILGNGFFKPNISTLLGNLYNEPAYKAHKDFTEDGKCGFKGGKVRRWGNIWGNHKGEAEHQCHGNPAGHIPAGKQRVKKQHGGHPYEDQ